MVKFKVKISEKKYWKQVFVFKYFLSIVQHYTINLSIIFSKDNLVSESIILSSLYADPLSKVLSILI